MTMNTAVRTCKYSDVEDVVAAHAFQVLGLPKWIAEGNVETLRWMRTGGWVRAPPSTQLPFSRRH